jgi:hypothetical protein
MKNAKKDGDYTFVMHNVAHSKSMCKWIMHEVGSSKYMTSHRVAIGTYEVITPRIVHLNDNSIVKTIIMGSIVMEAIKKCNIN